jgi:hypothetical protein
MARSLTIAAALALAACTPDFDPASKVDKLRVLAVRAEPPEIAPPGDPDAVHTAALTSLVVRADFETEPARTTAVVHVACIPTPGDPSPNRCLTFDTLRDATAPIRDAAPAACAAAAGVPVVFAGVEACVAELCGPAVAVGSPMRAAEVAVPAGFDLAFDQLRARGSAPELVLGVQAVVLAFAIDATPDELVAAGAGTTPCAEGDLAAGLATLWASRDHVLSTKQITIRGPDAPDAPNQNPAKPGIKAAGEELKPDSETPLRGGTLALEPFFAGSADPLPEAYTKLDAAGVPIESTREDWVYSWFSTAGEIDELHTRGTQTDDWIVGGASGGTPALVAAVVRDLRGGTAWAVRRVRVNP